LFFAACGSRTGLLVPLDETPPDAAPDRVADVTEEPDGPDAHREADAEAGFDAPRDVAFRDVPVVDICPDAGATLIYVLADDNTLYSFYPPTLALTTIGLLDCGDGNSPFSMAVDRRGIAYAVYLDGRLFRVDTASAACLPTPYVPDQLGFTTFGMGFVANTGDAGETLYVDQADDQTKSFSQGLATIDTTSYVASLVAPFTPPDLVYGTELTGTSDGRLFAFYTNGTGSGSHIIQVDKTNGVVLQDYPLQVGTPQDGYAFGFWGGDFWVFTTDGGGTQVTEFDPVSRVETSATTLTPNIIGAGVSTCAPE
ncbi:MAG TPA: hypothetical protein VIY73_00990, partial [Polyangiaceae bacterium]